MDKGLYSNVLYYSYNNVSSMTITFYGAAHEVTGSCHVVQTSAMRILFDCGMFQGSNYNEGRNSDPFPFAAKSIDALLVSHAHNDHTGRIPKLVKDGFRGKIYATKATAELMRLIWEDDYKIMVYNHEKFQAPIIYNEADIHDAAHLVVGVSYEEMIDLGHNHRAVFKDAGHIFGASFIELSADGKTIGFSGDIGNTTVPILKETARLGSVDVLLCESTYGDRLHEKTDSRQEVLLSIIKEGIKQGGTIMMPSFSLERTQEILYHLNELKETDKTLPDVPIFVDSPLAIHAIPIYKKYTEYYDEAAAHQYMLGDDFLDFPGLTLTTTQEESKAINHVPGPKLIIAGSGMMTGGRILHHAKRYLSDPNSTLVIVGYQAEHTLGRKLYEGAHTVEIHGEHIPVRAKIIAIGALSAHADQQKLLDWIGHADKVPKTVYCVHGEAHAATELAHRIRDRFHISAFVPEYGESVEV